MDLYQELKNNAYPGRGILLGRSQKGDYGVALYFIMGRSENSRNRVFALQEGALYAKAFDESKVTDPSLILYAPLKLWKQDLILTNGDQTDTIIQGLQENRSFFDSLQSRCFEPDAPHFTPRISGIFHFGPHPSYALSILKSNEGDPGECLRFLYTYDTPKAGEGHFIHTYQRDAIGNAPLESFSGEPKKVSVPEDMEAFGKQVWESLNPENKISLYLRYTHLQTMEYKEYLINERENS